VQLLRLTPAFEGHEVVYLTVKNESRSEVSASRFYVVEDATRRTKARLARLTLQVLWIVVRERPDVVISTGAAPGFFAVVFGKLLGARTVWVDSIANVNRLSLSGQKVRRFADLWLTQWPHIATPDGPKFHGAVL
jgi:UDP-N-acetylglucosamine:LPS N-acetylglucosamine transferase